MKDFKIHLLHFYFNNNPNLSYNVHKKYARNYIDLGECDVWNKTITLEYIEQLTKLLFLKNIHVIEEQYISCGLWHSHFYIPYKKHQIQDIITVFKIISKQNSNTLDFKILDGAYRDVTEQEFISVVQGKNK